MLPNPLTVVRAAVGHFSRMLPDPVTVGRAAVGHFSRKLPNPVTVVVVGGRSDVVRGRVVSVVLAAQGHFYGMLPNPVTVVRAAVLQVVRVVPLWVTVSEAVRGRGLDSDGRLDDVRLRDDDGDGEEDVTLDLHFGVDRWT